MYIKKNAVAVAVAIASSGALANSITVTATTYSAEEVLDKTVLQAANPTIKVATSGTLVRADQAFTFDFGRATKDENGGVFAAASTAALDYRSWLPTGKETMATNGSLGLITGPGAASIGYVVDTAPTFFGTWGGGATASIAFPKNSPLQPYFATEKLADTSLTYTYKLSALDASSAAVATDTKKVLKLGGSQLKGGLHDFARVIDVEELKKQFIANGVSSGSTELDLTIATNALASGVQADIGTIGFVITGEDFSWLDADPTDDDTAATGLDPENITIVGGDITKLTATTIEGTIDDDTAGATITITNGEEVLIPTQSNLSVVFTAYTATTNEPVVVQGLGGGAWTLNGASIDVYAVPQSANASVFMWLTNTGSGSVSIDASIFDGDETCVMEGIATSVAGKELDLSDALAKAIPVQCPTYEATGNRVRYNFTASAPEDSIRVSAAYRVGTDRVNLVTSSEAGN